MPYKVPCRPIVAREDARFVKGQIIKLQVLRFAQLCFGFCRLPASHGWPLLYGTFRIAGKQHESFGCVFADEKP